MHQTSPLFRSSRRQTYDTLLANVKENLAALDDIDDVHHEVDLWGKVTNVSGEAVPATDAAIRTDSLPSYCGENWHHTASNRQLARIKFGLRITPSTLILLLLGLAPDGLAWP